MRNAKCDCGQEAVVPLYSLTSGNTKSCGCLAAEVWSASLKARRASGVTDNTKHGNARKDGASRTYVSWLAMRRRCGDEGATQYPYYGARGIRVCPEWEDFSAFIADMGPRPDNRTLDRIDPNGNYEPANCRWATPSEQRANRRDSKAKEVLP